MLINALLSIILFVISGFLSLIPDVSLSDSILASILTANTYISGLSFIVPVSTLISILAIFLTIETIILTIKIINWFIRKIPTIS